MRRPEHFGGLSGAAELPDGAHRLKVLQVVSSISRRLGGPSKTTELCEALAKRGVSVTLFTTNLDERGTWLPKRGRNLLDVPLCRPVEANGVETWFFPVPLISRFKFAPSMAKEFRRQGRNFDVIHTHGLYLYPTMIAGRYARRFGIPYVVQPHGVLDPFMRKRHKLRKTVYALLSERKNLNAAGAILYTSNDEMDLAKRMGLKAREMVVPLGIDVNEFAELPPRGNYRSSHPNLRGSSLVLFMGRFAEKKGLDLLLPAFASVARAIPRAQLVLAGPDDEGYGAKVDRMIGALGLSDRVTKPGMVTGQEKLALLADADIWVLPSYSENFGHAVVEAVACGLPVVISNRVNIHGEISKADAGIVVDCDASQLASAMQRLLTDDGARRRFGDAARRLVRSEFTWDRCADRMIDAYLELRGSKAESSSNAVTVPSEPSFR